jgi:hypothetical protein
MKGQMKSIKALLYLLKGTDIRRAVSASSSPLLWDPFFFFVAVHLTTVDHQKLSLTTTETYVDEIDEGGGGVLKREKEEKKTFIQPSSL